MDEIGNENGRHDEKNRLNDLTERRTLASEDERIPPQVDGRELAGVLNPLVEIGEVLLVG